MKRALIFFCFFYNAVAFSKELLPQSYRCERFFLSTPHSGTHLLYCLLQASTHIPVYAIGKNCGVREKNPLGSSIDYLRSPLFRTHHSSVVKSYSSSATKLIFVVRDYKENIIRNLHLDSIKEELLLRAFRNKGYQFSLYIDNLRYFDTYKETNKLLVYYEDLVCDPVSQLCRILEFLGEKPILPLDKKFFESTTELLLEYYNTRYSGSGGSHSKGDDIKYHAKKVSKKMLHKIDCLIEKRYPHLWKKYLSRYKEH